MSPNPAFETDAVQRCALHGAAQRERWASDHVAVYLRPVFVASFEIGFGTWEPLYDSPT